MSSSKPEGSPGASQAGNTTGSSNMAPPASSASAARANPAPSNLPSTAPQGNDSAPPKKRKHRAGKKRRNRRQSFAMPADDPEQSGPAPVAPSRSSHDLVDTSTTPRQPFYRLGQGGRTLSNTSLESEALLDHRDQQPLPPRRSSTLGQNGFGPRGSQSIRTGSATGFEAAGSYRPSYTNPFVEGQHGHNHGHQASDRESDEEEGVIVSDRTPLISSSRDRPSSTGFGFRSFGLPSPGGRQSSRNRRPSNATSVSSRKRTRLPRQTSSGATVTQPDYDVNNPPSVPSSPKLGAEDIAYGDYAATDEFTRHESIINIDEQAVDDFNIDRSPGTSHNDMIDSRRRTIALPVEGDVCFPFGGMSEIAEEDSHAHDEQHRNGSRRKRGRQWPDLSVLDDWSREEKEERSGGNRAKAIHEPVLIAGRLRPRAQGWQRAEEDAPYRFTYFNEEFPNTIHSQTISELVQPEQSFRELFIPDPPELSDDESSDDDLMSHQDTNTTVPQGVSLNVESKQTTRHSSIISEPKADTKSSSGNATPSQRQPTPGPKPKRFGDRPTFWLDVLSPTDEEMRVISKTFGIHPLTTEDIMTQEAREKVELFRNYYFVNYRTFEQDAGSVDFLQPVNMYAVVFREGVISFHFSMIPHPANVRRRVRQLKDYLILSSDWISYALIDDITDVFAPRIQAIEEEVDDIDDSILRLHSTGDADNPSSSTVKVSSKDNEEKSGVGDGTTGDSGADMLRRVGDCRKRVMGLYRLLGNKPDVIKGFAKRCNEHWEVAPRSEIGLFLGDIQDHVVTMTGNLSHYEKILSRSHSNYLAQINIRMNERQEQTADVLGRLTVLGTIVLPMNIITGLWGMNCLVPGQDVESLTWFWCITAGLMVFGFACYFTAKRVYGIM
ncbi:MAG: hypothetical protein M4579_004876 [Chaenotheca gracillima]|nr:MAG: hypothetical protein M4579_004876 [Chaenotheca gracillima]